MLPISDYTSVELLIIVGTVLLLSFLLGELCDWTKAFIDTETSIACKYSYDNISGPVTWRDKFPDSTGDKQSPVNIDCDCAILIPTETLDNPLTFSAEYRRLPKDFRIYNDGHSVILYANWEYDVRPVVCGGPLDDSYRFLNACFRWGPNSEEGSEHTINHRRYAMELQATHIRGDKKYLSLKDAAEDEAVLIISYFFEISPAENPYLQPIVSSLRQIQVPYKCATLEPAPLCWFIAPFLSKYYCYCGSLTFPPCTEGVLWMIQPEPLGISAKQISKFRKLCSLDGSIDINTRPVQYINSRDIYFYD